MNELINERDMALAIIEQLKYGDIKMFASDGTGVWEINYLLSDDQYGFIENTIVEMLEQLIEDCEREMKE